MTGTITITAPASPTNTWFKAIQTGVEMPRNLTIEFDIAKSASDRSWAVLFGHESNRYLFGVDTNGYPTLIRTKNGITETLLSLPVVTSLTGHIVISFRERRFRQEAKEIWHIVSMWINGVHVATHHENVLEIMEEPIRWGFAVYSGGTFQVENLHIPELSEFVDWISIDPGEVPLRALERAIEGQYIKYFVRFNGRLRAWLPKATESAMSLDDESQIFERERSFDLRNIKTHIRQLGAYAQAEYVRPDLIAKYGHRFVEVSNPYLMTEAECLKQAALTIKRLEEESDVEAITVYYSPILEPEDHYISPTGDRIISARSIEYRPSKAIEEITGRKYTYGS